MSLGITLDDTMRRSKDFGLCSGVSGLRVCVFYIGHGHLLNRQDNTTTLELANTDNHNMQNYPLIYDADEWIDGWMGGAGGNGGFLTIRE